MRAVRPGPSPAVLRFASTAGASEVSRFSCMKCLGVSGVYDYAGLNRDSRLRLCPCCLPPSQQRRRPDGRFRSSIPTPPIPLFTLRIAPRGALRKTRGRVVRYSFLVRIFHPLLHAGLSRRTGNPQISPLRCAPVEMTKLGVVANPAFLNSILISLGECKREATAEMEPLASIARLRSELLAMLWACAWSSREHPAMRRTSRVRPEYPGKLR